MQSLAFLMGFGLSRGFSTTRNIICTKFNIVQYTIVLTTVSMLHLHEATILQPPMPKQDILSQQVEVTLIAVMIVVSLDK